MFSLCGVFSSRVLAEFPRMKLPFLVCERNDHVYPIMLCVSQIPHSEVKPSINWLFRDFGCNCGDNDTLSDILTFAKKFPPVMEIDKKGPKLLQCYWIWLPSTFLGKCRNRIFIISFLGTKINEELKFEFKRALTKTLTIDQYHSILPIQQIKEALARL